jgi:crossover junction endodeoxyribonuclease RuvC
MIYVGIDPGLSGSIAVLRSQGVIANYPLGWSVDFYDTPTLEIKSGKSIKRVIDANGATNVLKSIGPSCVIIEKVWAMTKGAGGASMGSTSAFNFGMGFGIWLGIIAALQIPHEQVAPVTWKKRMMPDMEKEKDASRVKAMQLFPWIAESLKLKKHHNRADALLLAEYGRRYRV